MTGCEGEERKSSRVLRVLRGREEQGERAGGNLLFYSGQLRRG